MSRKYLRATVLIMLLPAMLLLIQACGRKTPTPTKTPTLALPTPTSTPQILPPALVETDPLPGTHLALKNPIKFYFNQPMDRPSVEAAFSGDLNLYGSLNWQDDSTLEYVPDTSFQPGSTLSISIDTSAKSASGMALLQPVSLEYSTSDYLRMVQSLPADLAGDVNPTSAIVAAFNQPVVPLGADPASLPAGFTISPPAEGLGEWINTSTYIFYPQPGLSGGTSYQVSVNPDLTSTAGSPLESAPQWSFSTVMPRLAYAEPLEFASNVRLDARILLNFSYSMDSASVEEHFSLLTDDGTPVSGQSGWNDDFTTFVFTPTALLQRGTTYSVILDADAAALGGTPIGDPIQLTWNTVPELSITGSEPGEGGTKPTYESLRLFVSSYLNTEDLDDYLIFDPSLPRVDAWMDEGQMVLNIWSDFSPDTNYTLTVSPDLADIWGNRLGEPYILRFRTGPLEPAIQFPYTSDATFLTHEDRGILAQVTNLNAIPISIGAMTIDDLSQMYGNNGWEFRQSFTPGEVESWTFYPEVPRNKSTSVTIPVTPSGEPRSPGLYFMRLNLPSDYGFYNTLVLAISRYQATLKLTPTEALVWVVDMETNAPAVNLPVTVYDESGSELASGTTDSSGIFQSPINEDQDPYNSSFAMLGTLGEDDFGIVFASWNDGISPWDFDIPVYYFPTGIKTYVYTDRPIYRPGDTVYFRLVVRQVYNGRYSLPDFSSYKLVLNDFMGTQVASFDMPLSGFGTAHGEYKLPSSAQPGTYGLFNPDSYAGVNFDVANYRKPEINLQVEFQSTEVLSGTALVAEVNARYFFDAPAGNMPLHWVLYRQNSEFHIPNYQVGPVNTDWLEAFRYPVFRGGLGAFVTEGDGRTDQDGLFIVEVDPPAKSGRQKYTLEVTLTDESGLPVSGRSVAYVNPAEYYIGVHPDAWSYQAQSDAGFDIFVADWNGDPAGERKLTALFQSVVWIRQDPDPGTLGYEGPTYVPEYTLIDSTEITTQADGKARLAFTPPEPGTYQLDVSGDGTLTQVIIWVAGEGRATWPSLPNQRLRLVADREEYQPGDTAKIFVPNPFGTTALGLLTMERGEVMRYQLLELGLGGSTIPLALGNDEAPNVYVAVTLLGSDEQGNPDFRQGYVELVVDPSFEYLDIELTSDPMRLGPGEPVTFSIRVTDANGNPVQGEFSFSVVDLAVLALAEPNSEDIFTTFYGQQPLTVRTGISLAASGQRLRYMPAGLGGGGGDEAVSVAREYFPDTAYWDAVLVTDANGEATVSMNLPDSLTTWQALVRGLTEDTLVGETQLEIVTTKDLLVRPVTPRFLVVGDHAMLAAVVQNNTPNQLQGTASLQATGFILDEPASASQPVSIPPNGRLRLEWWGTAEDAPSASLRFSVRAGDLQDAVLVSRGELPILRYLAPQTFATSGILPEAGERLELVSLPATFDAESGSLEVELEPSMAAAMLDALEALEDYPYDCTEPILSSFLPNLVTYNTLKTFGIDSPDLAASLDRSIDQGLDHLLSLQQVDGGWSWCQSEESDAFISAYVLYGLATARNAGLIMPDEAINNAINYISSQMITPVKNTPSWELDRLAFENYSLAVAQSANRTTSDQLYDVRDQLSPWALGLLALTFKDYASAAPEIQTLLSDLQATAIRSATGVHWEAEAPAWYNMTSTLSNSAIVLYTLAQLEPDSTLIPDAVNFLMSNRNASGCWNSSYENAWILLAMDEVMQSTGELEGSYAFSATLNNTQISSGEAQGMAQLDPVTASVPVSRLYPEDPNALVIGRQEGNGRLYYTAALKVNRPVEQVASLDRGISVSRRYYAPTEDLKDATPVETAQVGKMLVARLTVVVPNDVYHFVVEDYIPAGTEILNTSLKTSQQGAEGEVTPLYDPNDPYSQGWGWWLFDPVQIYDDRISWTASYLPAGTYQLTYTLVILQVGEYQVLPARAWMYYFPEVQGNSAGTMVKIKP